MQGIFLVCLYYMYVCVTFIGSFCSGLLWFFNIKKSEKSKYIVFNIPFQINSRNKCVRACVRKMMARKGNGTQYFITVLIEMIARTLHRESSGERRRYKK